MSRKSKVKEVFLKLLLLVIALTTLLILPQDIRCSAASTGSIGYSISVSQTRIQEGLGTNITLNLRDANASTTYTFKINVTTPTSFSYSANLTVTTDGTGSGSNITEFWRDFANATTNYVGIYRIAVNETLVTPNFTVGLTDKLKYFRSETVSIRGSGYAPNETVIMDLKFGNSSVSTFPRSINVSSEGAVTSYWQIPVNASLGVYTLAISNATTGGTVKTPADVQTFTVEGACEIQIRNLANQTVAGVLVEVWNATSGFYLNLSNETDEIGRVKFVLEKAGNYTFKVFWKDVEVGAVNKSITENVELSLKVSLSNLKLSVTDEIGAPIPLIDLNLRYNYTTRANETISETGSFATNINGTAMLQNTFTYISYLIEARRYGFLFNTTFIKSLPAQAWNNITIITPTYTMFIQVLDSEDAPAVGLNVKAYEWSSGIGDPLQSKLTDSSGNVTLALTFGRYRLRLYNDTVFLNEVTVDLIQNQSSLVVHSDVYNVDLSVLVVDYFGQPIPNALVEFQRKVDSDYQTTKTQTTGADGTARFNGIIGGDSLVYVSVAGSPSETQYLYLAGPARNVVFKMDGYVVVAGYALETGQFVTIVVLLILIVAFVLASSYKSLTRRLQRRRK